MTGGSHTSGAVQKNIASPCHSGRTSHNSTSATSASAIGMAAAGDSPAETLVLVAGDGLGELLLAHLRATFTPARFARS